MECPPSGRPSGATPESRSCGPPIFAALFLGISFMASTLGVVPDPTEEQTVLSQIARIVFGDGAFYVLIQVATVLVLALAANTAFADFPRLSSFLARDGFMPRQFAFRGERLAFTTGIIALSSLAALLLVLFGASVTALIACARWACSWPLPSPSRAWWSDGAAAASRAGAAGPSSTVSAR